MRNKFNSINLKLPSAVMYSKVVIKYKASGRVVFALVIYNDIDTAVEKHSINSIDRGRVLLKNSLVS